MLASCRLNLLKQVVEKTTASHRLLHLTCTSRNKDAWFAPEAEKDPATMLVEKWPTVKHQIPDSNAKVDVSSDEWHFVERLFPQPLKTKPDVKPGTVTPGGYVAPSAKVGDHPYFVGRSSNYMPRVSLRHLYLYSKFFTVIAGVEGDIFLLAEDLRSHLIDLYGKERMVIMYIQEPHQKIFIFSDFVTDVKDFLYAKGF